MSNFYDLMVESSQEELNKLESEEEEIKMNIVEDDNFKLSEKTKASSKVKTFKKTKQ